MYLFTKYMYMYMYMCVYILIVIIVIPGKHVDVIRYGG